jgi:hypothetical protein
VWPDFVAKLTMAYHIEAILCPTNPEDYRDRNPLRMVPSIEVAYVLANSWYSFSTTNDRARILLYPQSHKNCFRSVPNTWEMRGRH